MLRIHFAQCWRNFKGVLEVLYVLKRDVLDFKALFQGCQHGVGERVSLRGAVEFLYISLSKLGLSGSPLRNFLLSEHQ